MEASGNPTAFVKHWRRVENMNDVLKNSIVALVLAMVSAGGNVTELAAR